MSCFKIIKAGILSLVQDKGRFGFAHIGLTSSGVMDEYAYLWANKLLENDKNTNVLELCFSGLEMQSEANTYISITGADFSFEINGIYKKPWQTYKINKGDTLAFKKSINGQRAYFCVKGGFILEKEFNSNATTIKENIGGLEGRALKKDDLLEFPSSNFNIKQKVKTEYIPKYENTLELRVLLTYQENEFNKEEKDKFFSSTFEVSNEANRMGIKLNGAKIIPNISGIISEGIAYGSIQIPSSGQPIILLKDRQTIGGYAKIATVFDIDCFKLSQAKVGTKITFNEIDIEEAQKVLKDFYNSF